MHAGRQTVADNFKQNFFMKTDFAKLHRIKRFSILTAVLAAEAIGVVYYVFAPQFIGLFDKTPGVIECGVMQARIVSLFYPPVKNMLSS